MNPTIEARKKKPQKIGEQEISLEIFDAGYQWLVAQALIQEVYADGVSFSYRFSQAQDFLQQRLRKPPHVTQRPAPEVKKGQTRIQYVLPKEIIAALILRYGFDVVRTLYNTKKIDVEKEYQDNTPS